jgi:hypothetical protein
MPTASTDQEHVELTPTQARQGAMMRWPLRVLILSTIAAAVGLGLFLFMPP